MGKPRKNILLCACFFRKFYTEGVNFVFHCIRKKKDHHPRPEGTSFHFQVTMERSLAVQPNSNCGSHTYTYTCIHLNDLLLHFNVCLF